MNSRQCAVVVWMCLFAPSVVQGNDTAFWGDGAAVFAFNEERIVMESEDVIIHYDRTAHWDKRWVAACEFVFRNTSDEAVEVRMGHPDWLQAGDQTKRQWAIKDFVATVDGQEAVAVHQPVDNSPSTPAQLPHKVRLKYSAAYTWTVRFGPRDTVLVTNTYRFGGFSSNGPFSECLDKRRARQAKGIFWRVAGQSEQGWSFEGSVCASVRYIVTTGRTWGRKIGRAQIAIQIPPHVWPHLSVPLPAPVEVRNGWIRWRFENWVPRDEIEVIFATRAFEQVPPEEDSQDVGVGAASGVLRRASGDKAVQDVEVPRANGALGEAREEAGPGEETDSGLFLPLFDTEAQARAWVRFARANHFGRDTVDLIIKAYHARYNPGPDPAVRELAEGYYELPRVGEAGPMSPADRQITGVLRRSSCRACEAGSSPTARQ